MNKDERCCGTGTCIINDEGLCWCGQQWNGTAMSRPAALEVSQASALSAPAQQPPAADSAQGKAP